MDFSCDIMFPSQEVGKVSGFRHRKIYGRLPNHMKVSQKLLALVLATLMIFGAVAAVSARSYDDVKADSQFAEQIDTLSDIGVIKGTSANEFSPDKNVTREQMAMLLFRLMLNKADGGTLNTSRFTDLYDDTYNGVISWAAGAGYILGTSATTFEPKAGITLQDAMTMLVRALGQSSDMMNAGYPWTYIDAAIKLGLDRGLENISYTETLTRAETAAIVYNALTADYLVQRTLANGVIIYENSTIIEEVFGYKMDEATLTATNNFALTGNTVVKTGYVTLTLEGGKTMTVKASDMGLENADAMLGRTFKLIWTLDSAKNAKVLSAVLTGSTASVEKIAVGTENKYVEIDGVRYNVVETLSDTLTTNDNEILAYAFENSSKLTQLKNNAELSARLGFWTAEVITAEGDDTASVIIIKNYKLGKLNVTEDGKINLADNKTEADLTGGFVNEDKAENGDYVLYNYNSSAKSLEIDRVLDIVAGTVARITNTTAKIGETVYNLGNEKAGITAESVRKSLTIGKNTTVVVCDDAIVAVVNAVEVTAASQYLVTKSAAQPVFTDGEFRYVVAAIVEGKTQNIFVTSSNVRANNVYRYVKTGETYTLIAPVVVDGTIASGKNAFVQNDGTVNEIAAIIESASRTTITSFSGAFYTLDNGNAEALTSAAVWTDFRFVTDANTVIIVGTPNGEMIKTGAYSSTITIERGAKVVAVFNNEAGSVETLRYLYISNGSLGSYDASSQSVRILSLDGFTFIDGKAFAEYSVFNYGTGAVETKYSLVGTLVIGKTYRTGNDGTIIAVEDNAVITGFVTGYTSSTITVGNRTYKLASDCKIVAVDSANNASAKAVSDAYMRNVSFIVSGNSVKAILLGAQPTFTAAFADGKVTVTPDFDATAFESSTLAATKLTLGKTAVEAAFTASVEDGALVFATETALEAGEYTLTFTFGGRSFSASFEIAAE